MSRLYEVYVIRNLFGSIGYWNNSYNEFKGYNYATTYSNYTEALAEIQINIDVPCEIVKVYNKTY